jgi:cell volume regulation protein A
MNPFDRSLWVSGGLLLLSVLASKFSNKLGIPSLLIFLTLGILSGLPVVGLNLWDQQLAQSLAVVAFIIILFDVGLAMEWRSLKPVLYSGISLATLGVFASMLLVAVMVDTLTPFTFAEGLLLGAVVSPTDAAAVFATLRGSGTRLPTRVQSVLELESGSNDPMSAFLTIALTAYIVHPQPIIGFVPEFFWEMIVGGAVGYGFGYLTVWIINRLRLDFDGLYSPLLIGMVLLGYATAALVGSSGFLAVFVQGVYVGNGRFYRKRTLMRFQNGLAWIMQIVMFITLGLIVRPKEILSVSGTGAAIALFLIFVGRPMSTMLALAFSNFSFRERLLISWAGLRGAVPIILATFPLIAGVGRANAIFHIVFFIVIFSVLLQGTTLGRVAKWLRVDRPGTIKDQEEEQEIDHVISQRGELQEFQVPHAAPILGKSVLQLGLPDDVVIMLIGRDEGMIIPTGRTIIEPNDVLFILAEPEQLAIIPKMFMGELAT